MNVSVWKPLRKFVKCTCGYQERGEDWTSCTCAREEHFWFKFTGPAGKQVARKVPGSVTTRKEAERFGGKVRAAMEKTSFDEVMGVLDTMVQKRIFSSVGELRACYLDAEHSTVKEEIRARNDRSLALVLARALDLWVVNEGGRRGKMIGEKVVDKGRIDALSLGVFDFELRKKYFSACLGGKVEWNVAKPEHRSINSTLQQALCMFAPDVVALKYGMLKLPEFGGWLTKRFLKECDLMPEPLSEAEFATMVAAAEKLRDAETRRGGDTESSEIWKVNLVMRQTGLRPLSVVEVHSSWVRRFADGTFFLDVKKVKGGTSLFVLPVSEELAALVLAADGYLLSGDEAARRRAVDEHTRWLKTVIAETDSKSEQGGYRLRDTAATVAFSVWGRAAAAELLNNGQEVNRRHYARLMWDVGPVMRQELRAAARLPGARGAPGNVVPMVAVKVA